MIYVIKNLRVICKSLLKILHLESVQLNSMYADKFVHKKLYIQQTIRKNS